MKKCLILFSNGLDSRLVVKILKEQINSKEIILMYFLLPFGSRYNNIKEVEEFAEKEKVNLEILDCTKGKLLQEYMEIIRKPKFGRGSCLNPCKDCKIFILKQAKKYAKSNNIKIIATGEVLGERPFSQYKRALLLIEKEAGLQNKVLRPLSAKLLTETIPEKENLIDREKLFAIQGRIRKPQIELAKKYNLTYPTPGGGCLLCEKNYCEKIKPLLNKEISEIDIHLLKIGRHFEDSSIILGRNEKENLELKRIHTKFKTGILIIPKQIGPSAYLKDKKNIEKAKELIQKYSKSKIISFEIHTY